MTPKRLLQYAFMAVVALSVLGWFLPIDRATWIIVLFYSFLALILRRDNKWWLYFWALSPQLISAAYIVRSGDVSMMFSSEMPNIVWMFSAYTLPLLLFMPYYHRICADNAGIVDAAPWQSQRTKPYVSMVFNCLWGIAFIGLSVWLVILFQESNQKGIFLISFPFLILIVGYGLYRIYRAILLWRQSVIVGGRDMVRGQRKHTTVTFWPQEVMLLWFYLFLCVVVVLIMWPDFTVIIGLGLLLCRAIYRNVKCLYAMDIWRYDGKSDDFLRCCLQGRQLVVQTRYPVHTFRGIGIVTDIAASHSQVMLIGKKGYTDVCIEEVPEVFWGTAKCAQVLQQKIAQKSGLPMLKK